MRVSVKLSICTAMAVAIAASGASAMDANEIFNKFEAQARASTATQNGGSVTRGLAVTYGEKKAAPAVRAAPATSVPSTVTEVPVVTERPRASAPSSYVTVVEPAPVPQALPEPAYTIRHSAPSYSAVEVPAAPAQDAATYRMAPVETVAPGYTVIETPTAMPAAARDLTAYTALPEEQRVDLRIFFEWNSASLKPEAISQLAELCTAIRRVGPSADNRFKIIGHTDKSGSDEYNLYLSNARAREVKRHLVEECAIPATSLLAVGEGERQSSPTTPANAPEERRVEIQFIS